MNDTSVPATSELREPTAKQIALTIFLLACFCLTLASEALIEQRIADVEDSLTFVAIAQEFLFYMIVIPIIPVPIVLFSWNLLLNPIFGAPKLKYAQALVLYTLVLLLFHFH